MRVLVCASWGGWKGQGAGVPQFARLRSRSACCAERNQRHGLAAFLRRAAGPAAARPLPRGLACAWPAAAIQQRARCIAAPALAALRCIARINGRRAPPLRSPPAELPPSLSRSPPGPLSALPSVCSPSCATLLCQGRRAAPAVFVATRLLRLWRRDSGPQAPLETHVRFSITQWRQETPCRWPRWCGRCSLLFAAQRCCAGPRRRGGGTACCPKSPRRQWPRGCQVRAWAGGPGLAAAPGPLGWRFALGAARVGARLGVFGCRAAGIANPPPPTTSHPAPACHPRPPPGHLPAILSHRAPLLLAAWAERCGPIMRLRVGVKPMLIVSDPAESTKLLRRGDSYLPKARAIVSGRRARGAAAGLCRQRQRCLACWRADRLRAAGEGQRTADPLVHPALGARPACLQPQLATHSY